MRFAENGCKVHTNAQAPSSLAAKSGYLAFRSTEDRDLKPPISHAAFTCIEPGCVAIDRFACDAYEGSSSGIGGCAAA